MGAGTLIDENTGRPVMTGHGGDPPEVDGAFAIDRAMDLECDLYDLTTGEIKQRPKRPSRAHVWDTETATWKLDNAKAEAQARATRNSKLAQSDWTQLEDAPKAQQSQWRAYRQALRDVTKQPGWPTDVDWPQSPASA